MKQGDRVWVSDESVECAIKGRTNRIYVCEYDGGHYCLGPAFDCDRVAYFWKFAVPVIELPEGYTPWYGGANIGNGDIIVDVVLRDGSTETVASKALRWAWGAGKPENDIIGYRVIEQENDYVDHPIYTSGSWLNCSVLQDAYRAPGNCNFLGYVSDRGELMGMPLMWRDWNGMLRPYKADDTWAEVRAVAVRMKR